MSNKVILQHSNPHKRFTEKWGWTWGVKNDNVRNEFKASLDKYDDKSIQKKLFKINISEGPKKIEDFV